MFEDDLDFRNDILKCPLCRVGVSYDCYNSYESLYIQGLDDIVKLVIAGLTMLVMTKYLTLTDKQLKCYNDLLTEFKGRPSWFGKDPTRKATPESLNRFILWLKTNKKNDKERIIDYCFDELCM